MDAINVTGIRVYGYTGALPEEQVLGQWFAVDLKLWLDLSISGQSDKLEDTLDYQKAIAIVEHQIQTAKFALIERLAAVIAEELLALPLLQKVRVRLTKERPPIPNFPGQVQIEIERSR
ncbi:MAG: dihydroneopterin aldolase [Spirulina sp. SIO3F2]|nr:dihydroneopterin aldolase [Spirulina sp. SIO3F2]